MPSAASSSFPSHRSGRRDFCSTPRAGAPRALMRSSSRSWMSFRNRKGARRACSSSIRLRKASSRRATASRPRSIRRSSPATWRLFPSFFAGRMTSCWSGSGRPWNFSAASSRRAFRCRSLSKRGPNLTPPSPNSPGGNSDGSVRGPGGRTAWNCCRHWWAVSTRNTVPQRSASTPRSDSSTRRRGARDFFASSSAP